MMQNRNHESNLVKPLQYRGKAESVPFLLLTVSFPSWLSVSLIHENCILGRLYSSSRGTPAGTQPGSGHSPGE